MPTVTFLFTDIEGSTRLWESGPEEMKRALAAHDLIIEQTVQENAGRVFKHTGDGAAAAFESAGDAIIAATKIQRALADTEHPGIGRLRIRMGVHTGEAEERDEDYFGLTVNRTARLMSAGHGGQVLVSMIAAELASHESLKFEDLGEHRLRDLNRPIHIFQLVADGLPSDFPPLRTLDASPNNLPILSTSFVGREREMSEVTGLIEGARLVTVTGVGGSGKTRVALQAAAEVAEHHPDGVWLVELAHVTDPDMVDAAVASAIDAPQPAEVTPRQAILDHLTGRSALLVIDNCEHLIDSAAESIEAIMRHAPDVTVVATSRELLGVPGEVSYGLRSMGLPRNASAPELMGSDALRLFEERATSARPGFRITSENLDSIVEICRRLDGMPLAIELAAARLRSFSPAQIAEHLDQRFRLLTGGSRTALPRQQTLTAAIDWSYRLLNEGERAMFDRLSVFQGGFTFEAVTTICSGDPVDEFSAFELIPALVDKSLVVVEDEEGDVRYGLLETLRQFARERLDEIGTTDIWRERHAEHFHDLSRKGTMANLNGPDGGRWIDRIMAEADNIRQAITWSLDAGQPALALGAAYGLTRVMLATRRWSEPLSIYEALLAHSEDLGRLQRAELLLGLGGALILSPDRERGIKVLEESVEIYRSLEAEGVDPGLLDDYPRALNLYGYAILYQDLAGDHNERYVQIENEVLDVARRFGDDTWEALALSNLAHHRDPRGEPDQARRLFTEAEAAAKRSPLVQPEAFASQRAYFEFDQGELEEARRQWIRFTAHRESRGFSSTTEQAALAAVEALLGDGDRNEFDRAVAELFSDPEIRTGLHDHHTLLAFRAGLDATSERWAGVATAAGAIQAIANAAGGAVRWDLKGFLAGAEAAARQAVGDETYESLRAEGASMTPEEVTIFLLGED